MSTVETFIEPQDKSRARYIHTVILRFDLTTETSNNLGSDLNFGLYNYGLADVGEYSFELTDSTTSDSQTFLIYGDLGVENSQCMNAIESLVDSLDDDLDMIWHVGDFAYDMYDDNGQNTDRFMNMVEPIASKGNALQNKDC